jgi:hypothetical protein
MSTDKEVFMEIKTENYKCAFCGKRNVKLWHPANIDKPLICAECAEKSQKPMECRETMWQKGKNGCYIGKYTGKKIELPKWRVDEKGEVPSYFGPGPDGKHRCMTDQLIVNLSLLSSSYPTYTDTTMMPAIPYGDDNFWGYTSIPEELVKWWEELPTR